MIIHTTGRNNCGGRCLIHAHVEDGQIKRLTTENLEACIREQRILLKHRNINPSFMIFLDVKYTIYIRDYLPLLKLL